MKIIATTDRLIIREFVQEDHPFIVALLNSEGWLKYIGNRNITSAKEAINYIENALCSSYQKNGYGLYLVKLKEDQTPIGMCGFVKREVLKYADMGFAFLPEYSGKGFAYESAETILKYGFSILKFNQVKAVTMHANERSIMLLERLGFEYEDDISINNESLKLFNLSIKANGQA